MLADLHQDARRLGELLRGGVLCFIDKRERDAPGVLDLLGVTQHPKLLLDLVVFPR
jgi:hypothetical protein